MTTQEKIRNFILDELNWQGSSEELTDDFPLIEKRAVDSVGIFSIVAFLEGEFGIEIQDEELVPDNFSSIGKISALVASKK